MEPPRLDLSKYKRGPGAVDEFTNVMDDSAPFVQGGDEPFFDPAAALHHNGHQGMNMNMAIPLGEGPIHEVIQAAVAYSKLNPNDLGAMLERIRIAKKLSELIPQIQQEAEEGREAILIELGISQPKPVRKPRNKQQPLST